MKLAKSLFMLGLACAATAASAQFMVTVTSDRPIIIGQLVPPQSPMGLNPAGRTVLHTSMQASQLSVPVVRKNRQPDYKMSNPSYQLDCYEQSPGVCERIADLLGQYGKN